MTENGREPGKEDARSTPISAGAAYASVRLSLSGLLRETPDAAGVPVPACPGWNVQSTVAHLVEICRRVEAMLGQGSAGGSGPAAVRPAADGLGELDLDSLLAEWERSGGQVESALRGRGDSPRSAMMVMDAFTHELDIRFALRAPFPDGHPAFPRAFDVVIGGLSRSVTALALPPLRVRTDADEGIVGEGEPKAVVHGSRADLYRSLTGRRTNQQIRRLAWSTDPGPWLPAFRWGPFLPPDEPVE